ncbi:MAG: glucokinase [Thiobacillaceae bacterium]|nr:glucokinase [Thiobacillaceae bacterium]MCX7673535.1 glucokinase [Thiobacillaceae bacterium]MDW8324253.1 glucokinase [Burkholderiales bacterium]
MIVLCGDVGGTNTRLALADVAINRVRLREVARYRNADVQSLDQLLRAFLQGRSRPQAACLAVAGPTDGRRVRLTNLDWVIDAAAITADTGIPKVRLVNDFAAVGFGLGVLDEAGRVVLQTGSPVAHAPRLALGPGTGLGVVQTAWCEGRYQAIASEGGHISFAPADAQQDRLLASLRPVFGRVSVERILSGPGLMRLYRFCLQETGADPRLATPDSAAITEAALRGSDPPALAALRLFCRILGQTAGDLALVAQCEGGVYLAGGIVPKILPILQGEDFLAGFHDKGRFSDWMRRLPVYVVLDEDVGLKGAALAAVT